MTFELREAVGVSAQDRFQNYMKSRNFEVIPNGQESRLTKDQIHFISQFSDPLSLSLRFAEDLIMFRQAPPFAPALFEVKAQLSPTPNFAVDHAEWIEIQRRAFIYQRVVIVGGQARQRGLFWFAAWVIDLPDLEPLQGSDRGSGRPFVLVPIDRMLPIREFLSPI
jgi:hypothetical protein